MGKRNYQGGTFTVMPNGERLKALRGSYPKQPPQHAIEELAGISRGQLTRYETGKPASAQDLKKLAEVYGVDPAELLAPEGLEMCNEILEEMCLFTNKRVVVDTNGNKLDTLLKDHFEQESAEVETPTRIEDEVTKQITKEENQ